jgi:hypothetical protein
MKMFFSVFFGAFCAIMAAAAVLYFIKEYQDAEGARQLLRDTKNASEQMNTTYAGVSTPNQPSSDTISRDKAVDESLESKSEATLTQAVTIRTADGDLVIPAGKKVHTVNEKSAPGTVVINYEGYTFTVPLPVIGATSR